MAPKKQSRTTKKVQGLELGDTGTEMLQGIVTEEYNTKLRDIIGIKVYDEMRKSDGTVHAAVLAISLPIRRAKWFVEAGDDSEESEKIREFVDKALFEWMTITWNDLLRQALLSLPFGVMPFEKVFSIRNWDGKDYVVWRKFAPRLPKSIEKWELENGNFGIVQRKQDGNLAEIPMEKLCIFINDKEGDNWWGTSVLRPAYKHWYIKNQFYRIDAIAFERQGLGVPYCKLPEGATQADRDKAEEILKQMRANHQAFVVMPHDYEIGFLDMNAKSLRDPKDSIMHHNREIAKSVLAMFLELGSTDSGSRALSQDQTELFLLALGAIAGNIADSFNKYAIPQLVDFNFDGVENYPQLKWTGIDRVNAETLANAYDKFSSSGGIKADLQTDEQYIREVLGLPEREYNESDDGDPNANKKEPEENTEDDLDNVGMSEFGKRIKKKIYPEKQEIREVIANSVDFNNVNDAIIDVKQRIAYLDCRQSKEHASFFSKVRSELSVTLAQLRKLSLAESNEDFKSPLADFRRALTLAEKKVDFSAIQRELDRMEEEFKSKTQAILDQERDKYIKKINKALERGDTAAVKAIKMEASKDYEKILYRSMVEAYRFGKNNIARELGVKSPSDDQAALDRIAVQSSAIADQHMANLTGESKTKLTEALTKGESNVQSLAIADAAIAKKIIEMSRNTAEIIMAGYVNHGRNTVITEYSSKIYAVQRSEILDTRTCNYCLSIDGRIIEKGDPFGKNTIFHSGCRGIWVAILLDEEDLPPIGGIPKSLRDRFGDAVNDLIQPKTPQTNKDSAARKETERRAKRNKNNK